MSAVEAFDAVDLIRAKRDGHELDTAEIDWLVDAYTRGYVADEQMSAMTMAIFLNGMSRREIRDLTMAMIASGERMDFSGLGKPTSDKHSTGGVGDKITLPLMPLVATFGVAVPQLSGRGLGHTGGTLDKLESIPGWRADLTNEEMFAQLRDVGGVICAAGSGLAPADKKLYALRDITGTVEAIPLIASSIMSKKIAEGTGALVLDVKFGSGAFLQDIERSRELARTMVELGEDAGVATSALITNMNVPLGLTIGNANEVRESVEVLAGGGPADVAGAHGGARTRDARARRRARCRRGGRARRRPRHGHLAPGRSAPRAATPTRRCPSRASSTSSPPTATACSWRRRRCRSASPRGGSAPAARARRTRCTTPRASSCTPSRATPCAPARRCSPCTPTSRPGSPVRSRRSTGAYRVGDPGDAIEDGGPLIADRIGR